MLETHTRYTLISMSGWYPLGTIEDGAPLIVTFEGPKAEERARQYAETKNKEQG